MYDCLSQKYQHLEINTENPFTQNLLTMEQSIRQAEFNTSIIVECCSFLEVGVGVGVDVCVWGGGGLKESLVSVPCNI